MTGLDLVVGHHGGFVRDLLMRGRLKESKGVWLSDWPAGGTWLGHA